MRYLFGAVLAAVLALHIGHASAAEMRWTMDLKVDHADTSVADAAAKRKVGVMEISGKANIAGETAAVTVFAMIDYVNGSGPWQVYMTVGFGDGSVLTAYGSGLTQADARGLNSRFQGPLMVVGGTGRYAGAHGGGTMLGKRAETVGDATTIRYDITLDLRK